MRCKERIQRVIKAKGLRVKAVAEMAGFTFQQFSDMLNGRKVIRADYLPGIARALGITVAELFEEE